MKKATLFLATLALAGSAFACTPSHFPRCPAKCPSGTLCAPPDEPTTDGLPDSPPDRPSTTDRNPQPPDDAQTGDEPAHKHHRPQQP